MANPAHYTSLTEDYLTAILNDPNTARFRRNDPPIPRNPEAISESMKTNQLFPVPRTSLPSGLNWFSRDFVDRFDHRFRQVSAAGSHTMERLEFGHRPGNLETEANVVTAIIASTDSVLKVCNAILRFEGLGELWMDQSGPRTDPPSHLDIYVYYGSAGEERVICFFENKNVRKSIHESYNFHLSGDCDGKGKNWVLVMQQACKYVYTQSIRQFVLCDYVYWAFVEIDTVDTLTHEFDYKICWRKWSNSGRLQTVRWCLAAFIMFECTTSNDDQVRSEKVVADISQCFHERDKERKQQERPASDRWSKESSKDTIASRTRSSRNPRGRLLSDELLKFCSDGELDYIYDIDIPETIQQITPLENENFAMCRTIKLRGTVVLEKTIVKECFPEELFDGRHDPQRQYTADRLLESELDAYGKLIDLQGDVVPYFYGMMRTDPVHQQYRSRGILIEYLMDYQTLDHVIRERSTTGAALVGPPTSTSMEMLQQPATPSSTSLGTEVFTPPSSSGGLSTAPTSADVISEVSISLGAVKENSRKGLAKIHVAGVRHGDISERNILVDSLGNVVYIDFGNSRPFSEEGGELDWESWRKMWKMIEERET
jgi:hypothetical protein